MKTIKTTKTKTTNTPKVAAKAVPAAGPSAPAAASKRPARVTTLTAPAQPAPQATSSPRRELTPDLIAARAYTIWEQKGRPHGQDLANWLLAERQLRDEVQSFTA